MWACLRSIFHRSDLITKRLIAHNMSPEYQPHPDHASKTLHSYYYHHHYYYHYFILRSEDERTVVFELGGSCKQRRDRLRRMRFQFQLYKSHSLRRMKELNVRSDIYLPPTHPLYLLSSIYIFISFIIS